MLRNLSKDIHRKTEHQGQSLLEEKQKIKTQAKAIDHYRKKI